MQCGERTGAGVASWGSWPGPLRQGRGGAHRLACLLPDGKGESVLGHFQEADVVPGLLRPPLLPAGVGHAVLPPTDLQPFLWTWPEPEWRRMGVYRGTSHTLTLSWPLQLPQDSTLGTETLACCIRCISKGRGGFIILPSSHHPGCY